MNLREKFARFEGLSTDWRRLMARGAVLLFAGLALAIAAVFNPDATLMHAGEFSWLPAGALILLAVGLLECLDAIMAKDAREFFVSLQIGILDVVVAGLIIFSIGGYPDRLSLMIAAFLIAKGLQRAIVANTLQLPDRTSITSGAALSVLLGLLIFLQWPTSAAWFLAFCLSADIGLRGWSQMVFALWLKGRQTVPAGG